MTAAHADRFRRIAATFTETLEQVPADAWGNDTQCEGWVARDVVRHLVDWLPAFFFEQWGIDRPAAPSVDDDPVGAWVAVRDALQTALDDPATAARVEDTRMGPRSFAEMVDMIGTGDVFLHTWDVARATGLDETLDPDEVRRMYAGMEPMDQVLRESGQFGPRTPVADDADEQTKLLAFIGRRP